MNGRTYSWTWLKACFLRSYFKLCSIDKFGQEVEEKLLPQSKDLLYAGWYR